MVPSGLGQPFTVTAIVLERGKFGEAQSASQLRYFFPYLFSLVYFGTTTIFSSFLVTVLLLVFLGLVITESTPLLRVIGT